MGDRFVRLDDVMKVIEDCLDNGWSLKAAYRFLGELPTVTLPDNADTERSAGEAGRRKYPSLRTR